MIAFFGGFLVGFNCSLLIFALIIFIRDRRTWKEAVGMVKKELQPTIYGDFIKVNQAEVIMRDATGDVKLGDIIQENE